MFAHRLIFLNIWSPVGETVWEGLGGMVLLEGVCLEVGFEVKKKKNPQYSQLVLSALELYLTM